MVMLLVRVKVARNKMYGKTEAIVNVKRWQAMFIEILSAGVYGYVGFWLGRRKDKVKYEIHIGEQLVNRAIKMHLPYSNYHLLTNVTLPTTQEGMTTQIDHVLICEYGIFVIETKHYAGVVAGKKDAKQWVQFTAWDKRKFQNPLRQNYKHVKELEFLFPEINAKDIHSLVVFSGEARFRNAMPDNVMHANHIAMHIKQFNKKVLSNSDMELVIGRIQLVRKEESIETDRQHILNLNKRF